MIEIPVFDDKFDLFDHLIENKSLHIATKKSTLKFADAIQCSIEGEVSKAAFADVSSADKIEVESIINTTNVMDSHDDVHVNGLWDKSIRQDKDLFLLQEHEMKFDKVISDNVKVSAPVMTWKELGYKRFQGETQALMFKSLIEKSRNEFMFNQYAKGHVKNHSVGMRYIKIALAVNNDSTEFKAEFDVYQKHINDIVNSKEVNKQGYFWAVTEARVIEGSAVVKGSNTLTPTTSIQTKLEQSGDTPKTEQSGDTQTTNNKLFI